MKSYELTLKGKVVVGILIILFMIPIYSSGNYILNYYGNFKDASDDAEHTIDEEENDINQTTEEVSVVESTETTTTDPGDSETTVEPSETTTNTSEGIYTINDLDDLSHFVMRIYFESNSAEVLNSDALKLQLTEVFEKYPDEKIAVEGFVNGFPDYINSDEDIELSQSRAKSIANLMTSLGYKVSEMSVKGNGTDYPAYKDYGNQHLNDRVEVYFSDHYIKQNQGK